MKKLILLFIGSVILTGMLGGCGNNSQPADDSGEITLTIWHDKEEAVVSILNKYFASLEPEIHVELEYKSNLTEALKMVGNDPNTAPDMYFFAHDKIGVYAEMGILAPITDLIPEEDLSSYMDNTIKAATYKETIYQLPIYYETLLFVYNKLYMSDDKVPNTTEELYAYMQEKTSGGHYGFIEQHSTPYYAAGWINGFDGNILNAEGEPELDSENTIAALEYHKKFVDYMPGETEYATVNTLFTEGMAHSTIAGPWLIPTIKEAGIDVGVASMPIIDATGNPISPYMGVQGIQVLTYAAENKKEAVTEVLKVLMDEEIQIELALASGCAPANEECYTRESIQADEVVMAMKETAENAVPMPNVPEMDVMWNVVGNLLTDINMRGEEVSESAKNAQQEALQLIENMQ
jgi:arabinogalactan oligomer/maltooligosaccharide transport system substrate-binding protein